MGTIATIVFDDIHKELREVLYGKSIEYDKKNDTYTERYTPLLPDRVIKEILFVVRSMVGKEIVLSNTNPDFIKFTTLKIKWALDDRLHSLVISGDLSIAQKNLIITTIDALITASLLRSLQGSESNKLYESEKTNYYITQQPPPKV